MQLNIERFEAWLFSQPRERIINAGDASRCFLCSFVKETTNLTKPYCEDWTNWTEDYSTQRFQRLPLWARCLIDGQWCTLNGIIGPITVGQMQDRYIRLFGKVESNEVGEENRKPASGFLRGLGDFDLHSVGDDLRPRVAVERARRADSHIFTEPTVSEADQWRKKQSLAAPFPINNLCV